MKHESDAETSVSVTLNVGPVTSFIAGSREMRDYAVKIERNCRELQLKGEVIVSQEQERAPGQRTTLSRRKVDRTDVTLVFSPKRLT